MDIIRFFQDNNIVFATSGHKHCRAGWVQTACPFCTGNPGLHLGFNTRNNYFVCWRCGWHTKEEVVKKLLHVSWHEARKITQVYRGTTKSSINPSPQSHLRPKEVRLPSGAGPLSGIHKKYLRKRNFDPREMYKTWGLKGTKHLGNYNFRIIAPIYLDDQLVSYQGRDVTGKSEMKYKACREELEVIPHKLITYGADLVPGNSVVVVEGITDVWRLGPGAVCTFGIKWKPAQAIFLASRYAQVFIGFDPGEDQAQQKADELGTLLYSIGVPQVEIIDWVTSDPGDLEPNEAKKYMQELGVAKPKT